MRTQLPLALLATVLSCSLFAAHAQAQRARTFVASYGNDSNPCTFLSPCRTFQQAVNVVAAGGEVTAIDSAGFGPITITQAVTVSSPDGVEAGIAVPSGGIGITINAGPSDAVALHGLTLDGADVGQDGIKFNSGSSLTMENCIARNFKNSGLQFLSTTSVPQTLTVSNSYFYNAHFDGILIDAQSSGPVSAAIERAVLSGNGTGLGVSGLSGTARIFVAVANSVAANNSGPGFAAVDNGSSVASIAVSHSTVIGNTFGVLANGEFAAISLAESTLTGNSTGRFEAMNGAFVFTYSNNFTAFNGAGDVGSLSNVSSM
jgi:hypothetical protein